MLAKRKMLGNIKFVGESGERRGGGAWSVVGDGGCGVEFEVGEWKVMCVSL